MKSDDSRVLILDFGSQFTQLIARAVREAGVYSEIHTHSMPFEAICSFRPDYVIFSGGPDSVNDPKSPQLSFPYQKLLTLEGVGILGICYGMQLMAKDNGGQVSRGGVAEYGPGVIEWQEPGFFSQKKQNVWLSHGDQVTSCPPGFKVIASTRDVPISAMVRNEKRRWEVGIQFHPEVHHTERGIELIKHFLFKLGSCRPTWNPGHMIELMTKKIEEMVGTAGHVLMGLSGGVDSTVAATVLSQVIGDRLHCVLINNGLLRQGEVEAVRKAYDSLKLKVEIVDASSRFLERLRGVTEPEAKRKVIGALFIQEFKQWCDRHRECKFLAQGTIYPDVIESGHGRGPAHTIKSHHNVGGLPSDLPFQLIEPLRELFKDEVRQVGQQLGIPAVVLNRHPFPGPGLAIRVIGEVTAEKLETLRRVDRIFLDELEKSPERNQVWQACSIHTGIKSVGVKGDARDYGDVVALRAVSSRDGMTADWVPLSHDLLKTVSTRILNEVREVSRVVYDISSKPPATIEWE